MIKVVTEMSGSTVSLYSAFKKALMVSSKTGVWLFLGIVLISFFRMGPDLFRALSEPHILFKLGLSFFALWFLWFLVIFVGVLIDRKRTKRTKGE